MSAGAWLLGQRVLVLIRLERVSCGLGWESGATRRPPHSIKQTGFSLIAGPWQHSSSLMCFKWARWNLGGVSTSEQYRQSTHRKKGPSLLVVGVRLQIVFFLNEKTCHCSKIAVYGCFAVFVLRYLENKAGTSTYNKLLLKSRKVLKHFGLKEQIVPHWQIFLLVKRKNLYYRIMLWWMDFKGNKPLLPPFSRFLIYLAVETLKLVD